MRDPVTITNPSTGATTEVERRAFDATWAPKGWTEVEAATAKKPKAKKAPAKKVATVAADKPDEGTPTTPKEG